MMKSVALFLKQFGKFGFVRVFFYPLTALLTTPLRLMQTLWNCRILLDGRWGDYSHFTAYQSVLALFYRTIALNLYRFGRNRVSPYLGLKDFHLSRFFFHTLVSLYAYAWANGVFVLICMFFWLFAHLIWLTYFNWLWVVLILFILLISTTFYANTFVYQNYNALGWFFLPIGLFGVYTGNYILAGVSWLLASFSSVTVVFMASVIMIASSLSRQDLLPFLTILPAALKLSTHFLPVFKNSISFKSICIDLLKTMGGFKKKSKYKFIISKKYIITNFYFFLIYGQFLIVHYLLQGDFSIIFLSGLVILLFNVTIIKFADVQSIYMLISSIATVEALQMRDPRILISYWILISPLPLMIGFPYMKDVLDVVPILKPVYIKRILDDMREFLSPVDAGKKVFMAFDDPKGLYENLFDGYRFLLEVPVYVATEKEVHFLPNVWFWAQSNYEGAPDCWGRDVMFVLKNAKVLKAAYVVVYQPAGTELSGQWASAGFKALKKFSWGNYDKEFSGVKPYIGETPDWWLLKKP